MSEIITLSHGSGGKMTHSLIDNIFHKKLKNNILLEKGDSAVLNKLDCKLAFTTDSYVITPLFFSGGDIGKLAVCGTVNDLSVSGARPLYLSCGFIIEEGFLVNDLEKIVDSMVETCIEANVKIVTGDTKVVPKGGLDKLFINTSGIGEVVDNSYMSSKNIVATDKIIVSGSLGEHECAILMNRENFDFSAPIKSDCAPLNSMILSILEAYGRDIRVMRDITRGGLATTLNEFLIDSSLDFRLYQNKIPIKSEVLGICELLGFNPLYMANEGKILVIVSSSCADKVIEILHKNKYGEDANIIGEVLENGRGKVYIDTITGGAKILDMLFGEQLPRIC